MLKIRTVAGNIEIHKIDDATLRQLQQLEDNNWQAWQQQRADKDQQRRTLDNERRKRQQEGDEDGHDQ